MEKFEKSNFKLKNFFCYLKLNLKMNAYKNVNEIYLLAKILKKSFNKKKIQPTWSCLIDFRSNKTSQFIVVVFQFFLAAQINLEQRIRIGSKLNTISFLVSIKTIKKIAKR